MIEKTTPPKILLTNGDSWTFGSEIMAPEFLAEPGEKGYGMGFRFKKNKSDTSLENDYYRIPRIWPSVLAAKLGYESVNLAWPARSNDSIYESTMAWLMKHYIVPNRPTHNLLVIIGWSSPERKNVIIDDNGCTYMQTIWPAMKETSYYINDAIKKYFKMHVTHLWSEVEYISRFVEQNYNLKTFCDLHKINYRCFNAFYETPSTHPSMWKSVNIKATIESWDPTRLGGWFDPIVNWEHRIEHLLNQWTTIGDRFILKDQGSFKSYIDQFVPNTHRMLNWHPSPESHSAWADYLHQQIADKKMSMGLKKINSFLPSTRRIHV
jgi:hypothetical protein